MRTPPKDNCFRSLAAPSVVSGLLTETALIAIHSRGVQDIIDTRFKLEPSNVHICLLELSDSDVHGLRVRGRTMEQCH